MDIKDYLSILRAHKILIALTTLAVVAVALGATLLSTPQYAATTRLFISTSSSGDDSQAFQGSQFSLQRVKSYADLVTGREISERVVSDLKLSESPRELSQQISASAKLDTVILSITVTDPSPKRAQMLSAAVSKEFVAVVSELETPPGKDQATIKATVVDAADKPGAPVSPNLKRNLALGLVLGLLLGAGIAVLRETLDTSVKTDQQIQDIVDAPVLGGVPFAKSALDHPLITELGSYDPRVEAFRVLRTNLQFIDPGSTSKVFVISSSLPEEGKTTSTINLAVALAQDGATVALVEGDLRRPKVSEYLNVINAVGVTTVMLNTVDLGEAMQATKQSGLHVLTSGRVPPNPAELLRTEGMKVIVEALRESFDIVLIDAPPLLPVTDAALLADLADGVVLVVRHGKTTEDELRGSVERIASVGARIVGVILNMTPGTGGRYGYGYGYGYGYAPDEARQED